MTGATVLILLSWTGGTAIYALLVASRLLLLAPYHVGWLMYLIRYR